MIRYCTYWCDIAHLDKKIGYQIGYHFLNTNDKNVTEDRCPLLDPAHL
jgi:hypothetical protein